MKNLIMWAVLLVPFFFLCYIALTDYKITVSIQQGGDLTNVSYVKRWYA